MVIKLFRSEVSSVAMIFRVHISSVCNFKWLAYTHELYFLYLEFGENNKILQNNVVGSKLDNSDETCELVYCIQ
jgi:hypothetical protein